MINVQLNPLWSMNMWRDKIDIELSNGKTYHFISKGGLSRQFEIFGHNEKYELKRTKTGSYKGRLGAYFNNNILFVLEYGWFRRFIIISDKKYRYGDFVKEMNFVFRRDFKNHFFDQNKFVIEFPEENETIGLLLTGYNIMDQWLLGG